MSKLLLASIGLVCGVVLGAVVAAWWVTGYMLENRPVIHEAQPQGLYDVSEDIKMGAYTFHSEAVTTAEKLQHTQGIRHYQETVNPQ